MIDIKEAKEAAEAELREEKMKEAKTKIKSKLREISSAEKIVDNLKRELEDLYVEIGSNS